MALRLPRLPEHLKVRLLPLLSDPIAFLSLLKIHHKYENKLVTFEPNGEQRRLVEVLKSQNRVIVLKPRQIGISTVLRAWAFWNAYTSSDPLKFGVISFHQRSAQHLRGMDRTFYDQLPEILQRPLQVNSATGMRFEDSHAEVSSYTASSRHGTRSFTLTAAHLSEFAFYTDPEELLATVVATVGRGQIIIESTPNLPGDLFHRLCLGAMDGGNGWKLVTFWWWQHAEYSQEAPKDFRATDEERQLQSKYELSADQLWWRRQQVATLGLEKFRREYPGCIEDAFHFEGAAYIPSEVFDEIERVDFDGAERVYEEPHPDDAYVIGVDCAAGVGGDYSAVSVVSCSTFQPVYQWRSNMVSPLDLSERVAKVHQMYNDGKVLCESNNHGHVVLYRLRELGVRNLWLDPKTGKDWTTTVKSKLDAYETLREYLVSGIITRLDSAAMEELRSLIVPKVTPEAPPGLHDDMADSLALAYRCLRDVPRRTVMESKRGKMDHMLNSARARKRRKQAVPWRTTA